MECPLEMIKFHLMINVTLNNAIYILKKYKIIIALYS